MFLEIKIIFKKKKKTLLNPVRLRHPTSECNFGDAVTSPAEVGDGLQVHHESHYRCAPVRGAAREKLGRICVF